MGRIHFAHVRNIKILGDDSFEECGHFSACGSLDVVEILKAYHEMGFEGYSQDASSSDCRYTPDFSRAAGGREHSDIENGRIS